MFQLLSYSLDAEPSSLLNHTTVGCVIYLWWWLHVLQFTVTLTDRQRGAEQGLQCCPEPSHDHLNLIWFFIRICLKKIIPRIKLLVCKLHHAFLSTIPVKNLPLHNFFNSIEVWIRSTSASKLIHKSSVQIILFLNIAFSGFLEKTGDDCQLNSNPPSNTFGC